jgi:hypothetical protein
MNDVVIWADAEKAWQNLKLFDDPNKTLNKLWI